MNKNSFFVSFIFNISRHKRVIATVILLIGLIFVFYLRQIGYLTPENIVSLLKLHPILSPFLFILFYSLMIIFLLPIALAMTLMAGFLWGWFWGGIIAIFSASIGASITFLISRYLVSDYLNKKFKGKIWLSLREEVEKNDWKIIALMRNSQVLPFALTSYFFGLTPISFKKHFWTTLLTTAPGTWAVAAVGSYVGNIILEGKIYNIFKTIFIIGLLMTITIILWYIRKKYSQISKFRSSEISDEDNNEENSI